MDKLDKKTELHNANCKETRELLTTIHALNVGVRMCNMDKMRIDRDKNIDKLVKLLKLELN